MMRRSSQVLAGFVTAGLLAIGGTALAGPALAGSWSGSLNCPGSTFVKSNGYKGGTGSITVAAPGRSYTDTTLNTGLWIVVVGAYSSGSWSVTGSGATSGYGSCGT